MFSKWSFSQLTTEQDYLVNRPFQSKIFLEGPAGCGKTTAVVERLLRYMAEGISGDSILLLVSQLTLAEPYYRALDYPGVISGGGVSILTPAGLGRQMVDRFWTGIAQQAGFKYPEQPPAFLSMETAQFFMARLVSPLLKNGYFESLSMERSRVYHQILDTLSKAAVVGFPHSEIGDRLKSAWIGEPGQLRIYDDVQECANLFRQYCLDHNLLDFSLWFEVFRDLVWPNPACREYLKSTYRHLIFDNIEEDPPVVHDILDEWLPDFDSALLIYDTAGGFRRFLGADPVTAYRLRSACPEQIIFTQNLVMSPAVEALNEGLSVILHQDDNRPAELAETNLRQEQLFDSPSFRESAKFVIDGLAFEQHHFYPDMLDWVADQIEALVYRQDVPPSEIVVLAPYLSDSLRFSVLHRLENRQVPVRSHRPSRSLREEPATRCLFTLSNLAYPEWGFLPTKFDVAQAFMQAIAGLDRVRAQLLTEIVYRIRDGLPALTSFDQIIPQVQARITQRLGERYEELRAWLGRRREPPEDFDHFISRMFDEILSQPGFGFENDLIAAEVIADLAESVQKLRSALGPTFLEEGGLLGKEFIQMIEEGVLPDQYLRNWQSTEKDAVLVVPAFTFLISNRPVKYQFWLDAGSRGWSERLNQPLTHAYVLKREWPVGQVWTDLEEVQAGHEFLETLVLGLLRRCRERVYLGISELGEQGYETRGPLLQALQRLVLIGATEEQKSNG